MQVIIGKDQLARAFRTRASVRKIASRQANSVNVFACSYVIVQQTSVGGSVKWVVPVTAFGELGRR